MAEIPQSLSPTQAPIQSTQTIVPQQTEVAPQGYTIPLLQQETNVILPVGQDEADVAVRSGLYTPKADAEFIIQDKYGDKQIVQGSYLKQALDSGFRLESSVERRERELQEQYGDVSGQLKSAAAGAARGLTFGVSDLAASQSPELQQELVNLQEANPTASLVGETAGVVGGLLTGSTEAGIAARAVGAGVRAAERAGAKAAVAVERAIIKDATKAGVPKKIAASLAAKSTGGAVEGALFGAGQLVSEDALGKADFNAENLLGYMGMGAILGGTVSGGIQAVSETAKLVTPLLKSSLAPLARQVTNATDEKVAAARLFGLTPNQLGKLEKRNPKVVADMQTYLKDDLQLGLSDSVEDLVAKNSKVAETAGTDIGNVLAKIDDVLVAAPELKPTSKEVWGNVWDSTYAKFQDFLSAGAPGSSAEKRQISKFLNEVEALRKSDGYFGAADLQKIKRIQDDLMNYAKEPGKWSVREDLTYLTRTALKEEIDKLAQKLKDANLSDDLATELKAANRRYAASTTFGDYLESKALKAADRDFSFMNSVRDTGLDISRKLVVLGKLEKAKVQMSKLAEKSIQGFIDPAVSKVQKLAVPFSIINSEFAKKYDDGKYKKPKSSSEAFANIQENMERYSMDPEAFVKRVNRGTSALYNSAPNTATALDMSAIAAATFLASKVPKRTSNPGPVQMFKRPKAPSKYDLSKLERYLNAVENPKSVFEDLERGRLSSEGAEALSTVYPSLYTQLQGKALELIGSKPVPYNKRLQLGLLLDIPTDESLLPENVLGLQANFGPQAAAENGAVNSTVSGLQKLNIAEREETDTQRIESDL